MSKRLWITLEVQRRNRTLSKELGAELYEFVFKGSRLLRYPALIARTISAISRDKPSILFVQNPSMVLALFAVCLRFFVRSPVVVDAHNAGVFPFEGIRGWANKVTAFILRRADLTIVTNDNLASYVRSTGGRPFVLPDPLPPIESATALAPLKGSRNVLFVCTYAADEPYLEVIKAASKLAPDVFVYISGNPKGKEKALSSMLPPNVVLTGYLPEKDYLTLICSVDALIDLTTREDCLVCGAYEAVSVGKPMILSGTRALRNYFSKGAVFTDNTAEDLAAKINEALVNSAAMEAEVLRFKTTLERNWTVMKEELENELNRMEKNSDSGSQDN